MSTYERYFDKTKCMYLVIKDETFLDKYMKVWKKVSDIIKNKFNSELVYNKKYLKAERKFSAKESFQCFYMSVILSDAVYRKEEEL